MSAGRVAVYTAIYGDYDDLVDPAPQDLEADWICFTDDASLKSSVWSVRVDPPRFADRRVASRWHKVLPDEALPEYDLTIWVDASLRIDCPSFVREVLACMGPGPITAFRHPQRDCVYDEVQVCRRLGKSEPEGLVAQAAAYSEAGHPRHWGLWACGVLARRRGPEVAELGGRWLEECERWTPRDQISFAFICRELGLRPATFPHHLHRHGLLDDLVCRLHRYQWFTHLASLRRAGAGRGDRPAVPSQPAGPAQARGLRRLVRTNPWFWIDSHRRRPVP